MKKAIVLENIGKKYRIGRKQQGTLRDTLSAAWHQRGSNQKEEFWALRGISFELQEGEVMGVIGRNGAGKSTLLKILSKITLPSEGSVRLNGRVASLLEVGTGFHPELTGRENVFLNGAILGMSRSEVKGKFDEIVAFAGVERFIDSPVKHFSSGMYVRLAFAVAAHLEAEILLIDEVLSVGDAAFQKKSIGKMNELAKGGKTVLLVSHNLSQISRFCHKSILLEAGRLSALDTTSKVIEQYERAIGARQSDGTFVQHLDEDIFFSKVEIRDADKEVTDHIKYGEPFTISLEITAEISLRDFGITIEANRHSGEWAFSAISGQSGRWFSAKPGKAIRIEASVDNLTLRPGDYTLHLSIAQNISHRFHNLVLENFLTIVETPFQSNPPYEGYWGVVRVFPEWKLLQEQPDSTS